MTVVNITVIGPNGSPASGSLTWTPVAITGNPSLPAPQTVALDGTGTESVTLTANDATWVWRVDELISGVDFKSFYVHVPTTGPVSYKALVKADPVTGKAVATVGRSDIPATVPNGSDTAVSAFVSSTSSGTRATLDSLYLRRYSAGEDQLRPLRGALARLRAGTSDLRISAMGDSITYGQNVSVTQSNHWTYWTAQALAARLGIPFGRGPIWLSYTMGGVAEPQVTTGAGWTNFGSNSSYGVGMKTAPVNTATSMDVAFTETVDSANILWQTGGGNTGNLIYSWDSGSQVTVTNPGGGYALTNTNIPAPSRGTHTLHLWQAATGNPSYYVSAEPQDSTTRKVRWAASGISGKTSTDLWNTFNSASSISPAGFLNAWKADLFIMLIGANDQMQVGGATTTAAFTANLESIRAKIASNAYSTSVMYAGPPPSQNEATWTPRLADFMTAAETWGRANGVPVARLDLRWKSWATTSVAPYSFFTSPSIGTTDTIHPGSNGTPDMGQAFSRIIAAEL